MKSFQVHRSHLQDYAVKWETFTLLPSRTSNILYNVKFDTEAVLQSFVDYKTGVRMRQQTELSSMTESGR